MKSLSFLDETVSVFSAQKPLFAVKNSSPIRFFDIVIEVVLSEGVERALSSTFFPERNFCFSGI